MLRLLSIAAIGPMIFSCSPNKPDLPTSQLATISIAELARGEYDKIVLKVRDTDNNMVKERELDKGQSIDETLPTGTYRFQLDYMNGDDMPYSTTYCEAADDVASQTHTLEPNLNILEIKVCTKAAEPQEQQQNSNVQINPILVEEEEEEEEAEQNTPPPVDPNNQITDAGAGAGSEPEAQAEPEPQPEPEPEMTEEERLEASFQESLNDRGEVVFTIPEGTGRGPWNSEDDPIVITANTTVRFFNADSTNHTIHTDVLFPGAALPVHGCNGRFNLNNIGNNGIACQFRNVRPGMLPDAQIHDHFTWSQGGRQRQEGFVYIRVIP